MPKIEWYNDEEFQKLVELDKEETNREQAAFQQAYQTFYQKYAEKGYNFGDAEVQHYYNEYLRAYKVMYGGPELRRRKLELYKQRLESGTIQTGQVEFSKKSSLVKGFGL